MRIAIVVHYFEKHGGFRVMSKLANHWIESGNDVTFIASAASPLPHYPTRAEVIWAGPLGGKSIRSSKRLYPAGLPGRTASLTIPLTLALRRHASQFDAVIVDRTQTAWAAYFAGCSNKTVYYIQAYEPEYFSTYNSRMRQRVLSYISRKSYDLPFGHVVNSPVYCSYPDLRVLEMIPPGIDLELFHPRTSHDGWSNRPIRIGCIGRCETIKGTREALDGIAIAISRGLSAELHIADFGAADHPLLHHPATRIIKPTSDTELAAYYRSLDVMVAVPNVQLGAPHYPVMEAMASGVPVITTGYMPATPENAWFVPINRPDAIADRLFEMQVQTTLREQKVLLGIEATKDFSWERISSRFHSFLENRLLKTAKGGIRSDTATASNRVSKKAA